MQKIDTFTNELQQLAIKFRINDEPIALKEIEPILKKIMSDSDILINCNINHISNIIFEMQKCIAKNDFIGLADYLAYDLTRAIKTTNSD